MITREILFLLVVLLTFSLIYSQENNIKISRELEENISKKSVNEKVLIWVYFSDKGNDIQGYYNNPTKIVSERSLKRRMKVKPPEKLIDYTDIPISKEYTMQLAKLGIKIKRKSKWLNAVSCYITKSELSKIEKLPVIKKITEVKKFKKGKQPKPKKIEKFNQTNSLISTTAHLYDYGSSLTQNEILNTAAVHGQGYSGKGILICLMDAGFDRLDHEAFQNMNIVATWDFVNDDADVEDDPNDAGSGSHGTSTLSQIGGFKEGKLIGTAYGADFLLAKTENTESETSVEEDNWVAASEWADSIGADVFSTSLGYIGFDGGGGYTWADMDGNTTTITIAADLAVGKGIVVFNSAGNEGFNSDHNTLGAPADGDSVVTIGAVDANKQRVSFSSVGNTTDGRIKPDFMAMGSGTYAASNNSTTSYKSFSGTSAACPLAAGVPALMLEKDYSLTPMQIREILRNSSDNSSSPNRLYGWGTIDALMAMNQIPSLKVSIKIFLEGAYNSASNEMDDSLNSIIPNISPYNENKRTINTIPSQIVDWVFVELRDSANGNAVASKSALLRKDGHIVADDGTTTDIKLDAPAGDYYIVVKHRNHLAVMSKNPVSLNTTASTLYDFTTGSDMYYGTGGAKQLK